MTRILLNNCGTAAGLIGCLGMALAMSSPAAAALVAAGDLLVDLRSQDLDASSTTWTNHAAGAGAVGDFSTTGGGNLAVASGQGGVGKSLAVLGSAGDSVLSASTTPATVEGNNTRSVEAWLYSTDNGGSQGAVSWGNSGNDLLSRFSYNTGGNGMLSSWFNDTGWGDDSAILTNEWVHVAWTYDGDITRGYINGQLIATADQPNPLATDNQVVSVGSSRAGGADPFKGYIADVRVHTGVLADADVLNNYREGIAVPEPSAIAAIGVLLLGAGARRRG